MRRAVRVALSAGLGVASIAWCVLHYGNPQWHRCIYMYQCHWMPAERPRTLVDHASSTARPLAAFLRRPAGYTGVWNMWDRQGTLRRATSYIDGSRHGVSRTYDALGRLEFEAHYDGGRLDGAYKRFDAAVGEVLADCVFKAGTVWQGTYFAAAKGPLRDLGLQGYRIPYVEGKIEGRLTVRTNEGQVYVDGEYRAGEPWDGTFIVAAPGEGEGKEPAVVRVQAGKRVASWPLADWTVRADEEQVKREPMPPAP